MILPFGTSSLGHRATKAGEPVWDLATLFPSQGNWTEEEYLRLDTNRLIEFSDGYIEVLPMPTMLHQRIAKFLFKQLDAFVCDHGLGEVMFAPLPVKFRPKLFREPDIIYLDCDRLAAMGDLKYPNGADLVFEVVSEGDDARERDYESKRALYAEYGVAEYWIVDPDQQQITVLCLDESTNVFREHGVFKLGQRASSKLLDGFTVQVDHVFSRTSA